MPELALERSAGLGLRQLALRLVKPLALAASRGLGMLAQVVLQIVVGAQGGPSALGRMQMYMSWTSVLGELVGGGNSTRVLREASVQTAGGRHDAIRSSLRRACGQVLCFSLPVLAVVAIVLPGGVPGTGSQLLIAAGCSAPLFALARLCAEALKGADRPLWAVSLENLTLPTVVLLMCAIAALAGARLTGEALVWSAAAGTLAMLLLLAATLLRSLGRPATAAPALQTPECSRGEQLHFWLNGLLNILFLQLPFLLMPLFMNTAELGLFSVAHKLVNTITTLLILLAAVFGPRFARSAAAGDVAALRRLLWQTQCISGVIFVPAAALLLLFSVPLAGLFSLTPGSLDTLLLALCAGQLVNAITGLPGVLLTLSGGARREMRLQLIATLLTAAALLIVGNRYGIAGGAVAVSAGIALKNLGSYVGARAHLAQLESPCS